MARSYTLGELAERLDAELIGDGSLQINGLGSLQSAGPADVAHLSQASYRKLLDETRAAAVVLRRADLALWRGNALIVDNPYLAFAHLSQLFASPTLLAAGIHPGAVVDVSAQVDPEACLGPGVVVGPRTVIGSRARIHANVVVGADCVIGADVTLWAGAVLYDDVHLGDRCTVHSTAVVGADGFGFAPDGEGRLHEIAQLGGVRVGADVSIGAASTIDRGALDHTVVEDGVKIDNQVQIGHNCHIGAHSVICGCVGVVGSTRIGRHCVLAGGVGIGGDGPLEICDGVTVSGMTHVSASITEPGIYSGGVLHSQSRRWKRNALRLQNLDSLFRRVARLEKNSEG